LGTISKRTVILLHVYTDSPGGSTDAVAPHVISAQIRLGLLVHQTREKSLPTSDLRSLDFSDISIIVFSFLL